jgi:hypothetical protein
MTKKDYIAIARILSDTKMSICSHSTEQNEIIAFQDGKNRALQQVAHAFAKAAQDDNPRFDRVRFLHAIGL